MSTKTNNINIESLCSMPKTIDYIYYVEWRQFSVEQNSTPANNKETTNKNKSPAPLIQMTHAHALVGEFHHVIGELKNYHNKMAANQKGKQQKRVRFQVAEKLYTCIPDVLHGCDISKIDKNCKKSKKSSNNSKKQPVKIEIESSKYRLSSTQDNNAILDDTDELLSTPQKNSKFLALIKKSIIKNKLEKFFKQKSRRDSCSSEEKLNADAVKTQKVKTMERSNSYCRHDDADNVILIDGLEIEEIDEHIDEFDQEKQEKIRNAEYSYV